MRNGEIIAASRIASNSEEPKSMQQQDTYEVLQKHQQEGEAPHHGEHSGHAGETTQPIVVKADRKLGRGPVIGGIVAALARGIFIVTGIGTRVHAEAALTTATRQDAVLSVAVTTPVKGAAAQEITLPANTQAFIDTPIYARTNGYLRKWYADIGARVHTGQVLAEIETPELDQQVQQAQSDLATAKANQQIAQITADRWTKLL